MLAVSREINWERRRINLKILFAAHGTNATKMALASDLSANTVTKFTNGTNETMSEDALLRIVSRLGLSSVQELDTDNVLADPSIAIKRLVDQVPQDQLSSLLSELRARFPLAK